jgi:hypothetical protein
VPDQVQTAKSRRAGSSKQNECPAAPEMLGIEDVAKSQKIVDEVAKTES